MNRTLRFGLFEIDCRTADLRKSGLPVKIRPQPASLLLCLAQRPGELVTREELQSRIWPDTVVDVDGGLNAAIRQVRQALNDRAEAPTFIETVPRKGYRFIAPVEAVHEPSPGGRTPFWRASIRRPSRIALALAALLGSLGLSWLISRQPTGTGQAEASSRLLVLPFRSLDMAQDLEILADGFTEDLIGQLADLASSQVRVIAPTSAMHYKGTRKTVAEIASEIDADYLVEGSVRRSQDGLRIAAHLVRAEGEVQLWAERYEVPPASFAQAQRDLTDRIARTLGDEPKPPSATYPTRATQPEAHLTYLKARYFLKQRNREGLRRSLDYFQQAIDLDPRFAAAYAGLGQALLFRGDLDAARTAIGRALQEDEGLVEAHLASAMLSLCFDWDFPASEHHFKRALALAPGRSETHHTYAYYLTVVGRREEAFSQLDQAVALDPLSSIVSGDAGWFYYLFGDYGRAVFWLEQALELSPEAIPLRRFLIDALIEKGQPGQALEQGVELLRLQGAQPAEISELTRDDPQAGLAAYRRWQLSRLAARSNGSGSLPYPAAILLARQGRNQEALDILESAFRSPSMGFVSFAAEPAFRHLRAEPRFRALLARVGLPPA